MPIKPTRDDLARMYPRALPEWLDAMADLAPTLCAHYGIERLEWCHIAGQVDAETDGLSIRNMTESMRYSTPERIMEVFSKRLGDAIASGPVFGVRYSSKYALAKALVGHPTMLADVVYGGPNGREGTPPWQGSKYLGRGPLQETHLDNYRLTSMEIGKQPGGSGCPDLVAHPEILADDPEIGVRALFAGWHRKGLRRWALEDDCDTLSDVLNTGNCRDNVKPHGLPRRRRATAMAKGIWPDHPEPSADQSSAPVAAVLVLRVGCKGADVTALQELLRAQGYAVGSVDGIFGRLTRRAVVAFQSEHALQPDGDMDAHDMEVLRSTAPADLGVRSIADAIPGSQQLAVAGTMQSTGGGMLGMAALETASQATTGFSPFAMAVDYLVKGAELMAKTTALGVKLDPRTGAAIAVFVAGAVLVKWGKALHVGRLVSHRLGLNLSR